MRWFRRSRPAPAVGPVEKLIQRQLARPSPDVTQAAASVRRIIGEKQPYEPPTLRGPFPMVVHRSADPPPPAATLQDTQGASGALFHGE